uniref:Uncharacterized protein n=1 Tax=Anguilla anguilla TaxID=7936 RepID=A0A0E9RDR9_ANGAN
MLTVSSWGYPKLWPFIPLK